MARRRRNLKGNDMTTLLDTVSDMLMGLAVIGLVWGMYQLAMAIVLTPIG